MPSSTEYLLLALEQARLGRGSCAPNPAVGAVIVQNNEVISKGYHKGPGLPHAEVEALAGVSESRGATVYVTLEPCCHFGKTPPCTRFLIEKGVSKVVYGYSDPNPIVEGKGEAELRAAGIAVEKVEVPQLSDFYASYRHWTKTGRPFVTLKLAMSLDGKISPTDGETFSLTGEAAGKFTHENRAAADAILTSTQTVLIDDPQLNVRLTPQAVAKPVYVVGHREIPKSARLFATASRVQRLSGSFAEILEKIGRDGVHDLWVEAGPRLASAILKSGFVGRAYFYVAPLWLGPDAVPALQGVEEILSRAKGKRAFPLGPDAGMVLEWKD